jgi:hypothetical protein
MTIPRFSVLFSLLAVMMATSLVSTASALPRFALLSGTRCSACHFNPQGGGQRTELGWSMMNATGAVSLATLGLDSVFPEFSNSYLDGLITPGHDTRLQWVKVGEIGKERRIIIPMQLTPYLAIQPTENLVLYGGFNTGGVMYRASKRTVATTNAAGTGDTLVEVKNAIFNGQSDFDAALQYQIGMTGPNLRVGMIQPSIGIRHDDHTIFARREAAENGTPIIPPNYNEVGAEITYEGLHWLTINAGIFNARNLREANPTISKEEIGFFDFKTPSISARVMLWPQLLEDGINGQLGASILKNGDFRMINAFAGIGLSDKATVMLEAMTSENGTDRTIRNLSVLGSYKLVDWLSLDWRYEFGQTEHKDANIWHADAFIFGLEFFPMPYVELRPEYRYFHRDPFLQTSPSTYTAQYTLQLHLFY